MADGEINSFERATNGRFCGIGPILIFGSYQQNGAEVDGLYLHKIDDFNGLIQFHYSEGINKIVLRWTDYISLTRHYVERKYGRTKKLCPLVMKGLFYYE